MLIGLKMAEVDEEALVAYVMLVGFHHTLGPQVCRRWLVLYSFLTFITK